MKLEFVHHFAPGKDGAQTLLLLHGTGGDENDLLPVGRSMAPNAAMLSPRGRVDEQGAARFFRRLRPGVFDEESILAEAAALETFVRDAAELYQFDSTRVTAIGYSNGANIAAALLLLYPKLLSAAVLLRATLPLEPQPLLQIAGSPVLILAGQHDEMIAKEGTERLAQMLAFAGASVEVRWHNLGHELGPEDFTAMRDFVKSLS